MIRWYFDSLFLSLLVGQCAGPVRDEAKLQAIRAEAATLMATHPVEQEQSWREVPKADWPSTITSLRPEWVGVNARGVDITTKVYFDGGWGYTVIPRNAAAPTPAACYRQLTQGVFWHGPC